MSVPDLTASLTHTVHHMNSRWPACKEALFCCPPRGGELQGIVNLPLSSTWNFVTVRELVANGPGSKSSPCPCWPPIVWPQPLLPPGDFYQMGCVRRDAIKPPPSGKGLQIRLKLWTLPFPWAQLGSVSQTSNPGSRAKCIWCRGCTSKQARRKTLTPLPTITKEREQQKWPFDFRSFAWLQTLHLKLLVLYVDFFLNGDASHNHFTVLSSVDYRPPESTAGVERWTEKHPKVGVGGNICRSWKGFVSARV